MGRKSNLSDEQWAIIGKRLIEGEGAVALGKEFGVKESTIRSHFQRKGQHTQTIQQVAGMIFETEAALRAMPITAQVQARTLASRMRAISEDLAAAAENNSKTALRLSALANDQAQTIDDAAPLANPEPLKNTVLLVKASNEAMATPLALLSANRDYVKRLNEDEPVINEEITPERLQEGARRLAFVLHRAAAQETS